MLTTHATWLIAHPAHFTARSQPALTRRLRWTQRHRLTRPPLALSAGGRKPHGPTIAMGAGMLPVALGLGAEPSFRAPMAIVVIGGLITSTFLSLLVIPVVFTYVDDLKGWGRRLVRGGEARPKGGEGGEAA